MSESKNQQGRTTSTWREELCNWGILSEYRNVLFGISILAILFFHLCSRIDHSTSLYLLMRPFRFGKGAVDAFLFLSALGLYFSFKKNPNLPQFYKRRYVRILPAFFVVAIPETLWFCWALHSKASFWMHMSGITWITSGHRTFWYVYLLCALYLAFPLFFKLIEGAKSDRQGLAIMFGLSLLCFFAAGALAHYDFRTYKFLEIGLYRIPPFLFGCWAGKMAYEKKPFSGRTLLELLVVTLALMFLNTASHGAFPRWAFDRFWIGTAAILCCLVLSMLFKAFDYSAKAPLLCFYGKYSLEIFLVQMGAQKMWTTYRKLIITTPSDKNQLLFVIVYVVLVTGISVLVHKICEPIIKALSK